MWRIAAVALVSFALTACGGGTPEATDAQVKWQVDVQHHGGPTDGVYDGSTGQTLGDAACTDIKNGNVAANEVIGVSNDRHLTMTQAEVVVYYAIADLCPQYSSQSQEHWADGT